MFKRIVRQSLKSMMKTFLPRNRFMVSMPESEKTVYLTFDDGPDPEQTARVLDALKEHGIKATFFVIGEKISRNPDIFKRILDEGHAIGQHTYFHKLPNETSADQLANEIEQTEKLLHELTDSTSKLFRPPLGKLTPGKFMHLWKSGKSICLWNNDPKDFACENIQQVLNHFDDEPIQSGDVVLLHDNQPYAADVIDYLSKQANEFQLKFGTLAHLNQ